MDCAFINYPVNKINSAKAICRHFNVSLDWLLISGSELYNVGSTVYHSQLVIRIPVLGRTPAGVPMKEIVDILDFEEVPTDWARCDKEFFPEVQGRQYVPLISQ